MPQGVPPGGPKKKPWRKILYEKQAYPDNYTDHNIFLKDLKKNIDFHEVSFLEACLGANLVLQEFCTVVFFAVVYMYMVSRWIESWVLLYGMTFTGFVCFVFYRCIRLVKTPQEFTIDRKKHSLGHDVRTVLTFIAFGQLFSPVLHTLTDTISTDTIHTMAFLMFIVHLVFFDYGVPAAIVSKSVSLSAAIFASICLASRLASASEAFVLLALATQLFALSPILRNLFNHHPIITAILFLIDLHFLLLISSVGAVLFLSAVFLINLICPVLFVKYQKHKDNIYGPWDEAVVKDVDNIRF
uniref:Phosphatidylinositol N-acetylglucosaminyltransferase subunit C n=1 Tax=Dendroctonus ponderosae TaxID=77166 RepID=J3JTI9_DENPD|nr:unknown [Dendroctonus ponderosae]